MATLAALLLALGSPTTQASEPAPSPSIAPTDVAQARIPDSVRLKQGPGRPTNGDDSPIRITPPTRQQLFDIRSGLQILREFEGDFKDRAPTQVFLVPGPLDDFTMPNGPTLGPNWYQNRKNGKGADVFGRRGDMGAKDGKAVHAVGAPSEAAVLAEGVASPNLFVRTQMELGGPGSQAGLLLRAEDPNKWYQAVDQKDVNSFYYVLVGDSQVSLGKSVEGKRTELAAAPYDGPRAFTLSAQAYQDRISVRIDDAEVLTFADAELDGAYVGLYALDSVGEPTTFENIAARRYEGPYIARSFPPSMSVIPTASIHHGPLRFEQVMLERYGQTLGFALQPSIAHAEFWFDFIMLPYSQAKTPPWVCVSSGAKLPKAGEPVYPYRVLGPAIDERGIAAEAATFALAFALLP